MAIIKIAMFTDTYIPQINGVVTSINSSVEGLERKKYDVHIFAPQTPEISYPKNVHVFKSVPFLPYPEYRIGVPPLDVSKKFFGIGFDIVHIHSPLSVGSIGLGLAKLGNKPVVGTFHTLLPEYLHYLGDKIAGSKNAKKVAWKYCVWFYNKCDVVIAPSEYIAALLEKKGITKPIRVVPSSIPALKPKARPKKKAGKRLLHVGRLTVEKNIETVLHAVKKVEGAELVIASDGPYRKKLEDYAKRLGISDRVFFTGYLPRDELNRQYDMADAFVFASRSETQAVVILEAAQHSLPVVCLNDPVVGSFVKKHGLGMVATKSTMPQAIEKVLTDKNLRACVSRKARRILKDYSVEASRKKLLAVYGEAIELKRKARSTASNRARAS